MNDCTQSILKQTIDNHIEDAERWGGNLPVGDPMQMNGWRPTAYVLAQEVRRLRTALKSICDLDEVSSYSETYQIAHEALTRVNP